jgi:hypothetical protein
LVVDTNFEGILRIELQRRLVIRIQVACYLHDRKTIDSGHNLKDFNAHSRNAAISDSQRARRAKRKVAIYGWFSWLFFSRRLIWRVLSGLIGRFGSWFCVRVWNDGPPVIEVLGRSRINRGA